MANDQTVRDLVRSRDWKGDPLDRETAEWADRLASDLRDWCERNSRPSIRARASSIAAAVEPYLGLTRAFANIERMLGVQLH